MDCPQPIELVQRESIGQSERKVLLLCRWFAACRVESAVVFASSIVAHQLTADDTASRTVIDAAATAARQQRLAMSAPTCRHIAHNTAFGFEGSKHRIIGITIHSVQHIAIDVTRKPSRFKNLDIARYGHNFARDVAEVIEEMDADVERQASAFDPLMSPGCLGHDAIGSPPIADVGE